MSIRRLGPTFLLYVISPSQSNGVQGCAVDTWTPVLRPWLGGVHGSWMLIRRLHLPCSAGCCWQHASHSANV
jgi:hypothetical protein